MTDWIYCKKERSVLPLNCNQCDCREAVTKSSGTATLFKLEDMRNKKAARAIIERARKLDW